MKVFRSLITIVILCGLALLARWYTPEPPPAADSPESLAGVSYLLV